MAPSRATLILSIALAGPASAGQPISESLAECAAIYDMSADILDHRPDRAARLRELGEVYYDAALAEAGAEGRSDPLAYAERTYGQKCEKWRGISLLRLAFDSDLKDWAAYCRALGKARGLPRL